MDVDASDVDIGVVLAQEGDPIEFFSENFITTRKKWSVYEQELYAVICALKKWTLYVASRFCTLQWPPSAAIH